jgi:hypothetical protein
MKSGIMISWSLETPDSSLELKAKKLQEGALLVCDHQRQLHAGPTENKSPIIKSSQDEELRRRSVSGAYPLPTAILIRAP